MELADVHRGEHGLFFRAKDIVLVKGEIITSDAPSVLITDLTGKIMR